MFIIFPVGFFLCSKYSRRSHALDPEMEMVDPSGTDLLLVHDCAGNSFFFFFTHVQSHIRQYSTTQLNSDSHSLSCYFSYSGANGGSPPSLLLLRIFNSLDASRSEIAA